jgi:hypothetical protein
MPKRKRNARPEDATGQRDQSDTKIALSAALQRKREEHRVQATGSGPESLVVLPKHLSLLDNTEQTTKFLDELHDKLTTGARVYLDSGAVRILAQDGIVALLAVIARFKESGLKIRGNFPSSDKASRAWMHSGFFEALKTPELQTRDAYRITSGTGNIVSHAGKRVDPALTAGLLASASRFIWGEERWCKGAQRVLLELMHNTNNHASPLRLGEKHWWLSMEFDIRTRVVRFAFVDLGVGIFRSLDGKAETDPWSGWRARLEEVSVADASDAQLLRRILEGEVHLTATGQAYRGKGLPGIAQEHVKGGISGLRIVSNRVNADIDKDRFVPQPRSFSGTLVCWQLSEQNASTRKLE